LKLTFRQVQTEGTMVSGSGHRSQYPRLALLMGWVLWFFMLVGLLGGCAPTTTNPAGVTQVSTLDALMDGVYESNVTIGKLTQQGNLGLGTPDQLNGEMIVLDGDAYRVDVSGTVQKLSSNTRTPFAVVASMNSPRTKDLASGIDFINLKSIINRSLHSPNYIQTIRVDGKFDTVVVRSVPRQNPPYKRLAEVVKNQQTFEYTNLNGTLVGFRFPAYMQRLNVEGYHLHFLSNDGNRGGHVIDFSIENAELKMDTERNFELILPEDQLFEDAELTEAPSDDVESVEKK